MNMLGSSISYVSHTLGLNPIIHHPLEEIDDLSLDPIREDELQELVDLDINTLNGKKLVEIADDFKQIFHQLGQQNKMLASLKVMSAVHECGKESMQQLNIVAHTGAFINWLTSDSEESKVEVEQKNEVGGWSDLLSIVMISQPIYQLSGSILNQTLKHQTNKIYNQAFKVWVAKYSTELRTLKQWTEVYTPFSTSIKTRISAGSDSKLDVDMDRLSTLVDRRIEFLRLKRQYSFVFQ